MPVHSLPHFRSAARLLLPAVASWSFEAHSLTPARAANDSAVEAQSPGSPPASVAKLCSTVAGAISVPPVSAAPPLVQYLLCSSF
ncbi:uncharacterized protein DS421_14g472200 [Arachis hypogaea]|nr:uncharacterized protein DS421_14g472200 [Arachis hypogaea]